MSVFDYVPPDGPVPCDTAIVGEAPARDEVRFGMGFVGPSGKLLWPVLRRLAGLERADCYVTNLSKVPLPDEGEKLTPEEFELRRVELLLELQRVSPKRILAVGVLAARALMETSGRKWHRMEVHNGITYDDPVHGWYFVPCWHPAAALYEDTGKDPLAWMGDAMSHFTSENRRHGALIVPPSTIGASVPQGATMVGIDTEGTPDDPICLTWATERQRVYVEPKGVPALWKILADLAEQGTVLAYHHATWDWKVIEAMGVEDAWRLPFVDTMELAYLKHASPQGLKDLVLRHYGLDTPSFEELVMPHYEEIIRAIVKGRVEAGTTVITHSPKTGKPFKKPQVKMTDEAKRLARVSNLKTLAERIGEFPPMSLRMVPFEELVEYATLDPWITLKVWEALR